jgi:hypothetical protein
MTAERLLAHSAQDCAARSLRAGAMRVAHMAHIVSKAVNCRKSSSIPAPIDCVSSQLPRPKGRGFRRASNSMKMLKPTSGPHKQKDRTT